MYLLWMKNADLWIKFAAGQDQPGGVRRSGSGRNIGRSGVRYLWMKNVVLWTKSALMDEKRHFMDQICTLWMRIAFMDEKRRFMDQICTLWTRFALMDEKRIFYGKKKYQPH